MKTELHAQRQHTISILLLAFVAVIVYANTLHSPFVFDDLRIIKDNEQVRLEKPAAAGIGGAAFKKLSRNRPVAMLTFVLNYSLHGYDVVGFHLFNVFIHFAAGVCLYFLAAVTLGTAPLRSRYGSFRWLPFAASLMWLVHPLHTQSVAYIVQRMNSVASLFFMLSLLLYARARAAGESGPRRILFAGSVLAGLLALGSKEIAVMLPVFIILYEWYFFQNLDRDWLRRRIPVFAGVLLLLVVVTFVFLGGSPVARIMKGYEGTGFSLWERLLTEFRVVFLYLGLIAFPHPSRLNLDYAFPLSHSPFTPPTTLFAILGVLFLLGASIRLARNSRLLSFSILWFLGNLLVESSVFALDLVFEHRTYLPSTFLLLGILALARRTIRPKGLRIGGFALVTFLFAFWTYERNKVWQSGETLWRDCVAKSPLKPRPHNSLGSYLAVQGRKEEAIHHHRMAVKLRPDYASAHHNLAHALASQGKLNEAVHHYREALRIKPDHGRAHVNLGNVLAARGKHDEALALYVQALQVDSTNAEACYNTAATLARQGKRDEAIEYYLRTLRIKPAFAKAHNNLAVSLAGAERFQEAETHYREAVRLKPGYSMAHYNFGNALLRQGRIAEAREQYSIVLGMQADHQGALSRMEHIRQLQVEP